MDIQTRNQLLQTLAAVEYYVSAIKSNYLVFIVIVNSLLNNDFSFCNYLSFFLCLALVLEISTKYINYCDYTNKYTTTKTVGIIVFIFSCFVEMVISLYLVLHEPQYVTNSFIRLTLLTIAIQTGVSLTAIATVYPFIKDSSGKDGVLYYRKCMRTFYNICSE